MKAAKTFVIAEAGVNHNGSVDRAIALCDAARQAGADAVKFQTFRSSAVLSRHARKAAYQVSNTGTDGTQLDMVRSLELDQTAHERLARHCAASGIRFLSTPFDESSVTLLDRVLDIPLFKIPSGEINNPLLLLAIAATGKPVILSTGMSTLGDIEMALGILAFGYCGMTLPSREGFSRAYQSRQGQEALADKVTLLHCTTEYPAPLEDVNLRVLETLTAAFGLPVGYSDHTRGIAVPIAAVARGAIVIEKHLTLDRTLPGPDHIASLEPPDFAAMVAGIRDVEIALGHGRKFPTASEVPNMSVARKSLVAARAISAGEVFTADNLTVKRPGTGVPAIAYFEHLGHSASRDYVEDELVDQLG